MTGEGSTDATNRASAPWSNFMTLAIAIGILISNNIHKALSFTYCTYELDRCFELWDKPEQARGLDFMWLCCLYTHVPSFSAFKHMYALYM